MTTVLQTVQKLVAKKKVPDVRVGHTVRVHQRIKEGEKERIQVYEGLIIKMNSGHGADKTITVRKLVEGIGVEKIFPLYSPVIEKIEIKKESKVRRAKLYFMRDRSGKSARLKENLVSEQLSEKEMEAAIDEAREAAEKREKEEAAQAEGTSSEEMVTEETSPIEEPVTEEAAAEEAAIEAEEAISEEESKEEENKKE